MWNSTVTARAHVTLNQLINELRNLPYEDENTRKLSNYADVLSKDLNSVEQNPLRNNADIYKIEYLESQIITAEERLEKLIIEKDSENTKLLRIVNEKKNALEKVEKIYENSKKKYAENIRGFQSRELKLTELLHTERANSISFKRQIFEEKKNAHIEANPATHSDIEQYKDIAKKTTENMSEEYEMNIAVLKDQIEDLKKQNLLLKEAPAATKKELELFANMKLLIEKYRNKLKKYEHVEEELNTARLEITELKNAVEIRQKDELSFIETVKLLTRTKEELKTAYEELSAWRKMAKSYCDETPSIQALNRAIVRYHQTTQVLAHEKLVLAKEKHNGENELNEMKTKHATVTEEKTTLSAQNETLKTTVDKLENDNKRLKNRIEIFAIGVAGVSSRSESEKIQILLEELKEKEALIEEMKLSKENGADGENAYKENIEILTTQNTSLRSQIGELKSSIDTCIQEKETMQSLLEELHSQASIQQQKYKSLQKNYAELSNNSGSPKAANSDVIQQLKEEVESLRNTLEEKDVYINNKKKRKSEGFAEGYSENNFSGNEECLRRQISAEVQKNNIIKDFFRQTITDMRSAILRFLGWQLTIDEQEEEIRYRFSCTYSNHDGEIIFSAKNDTEKEREFQLFFSGHYATLWEMDISWQNILRTTDSFPVFLGKTLLSEFDTES